MTTVLCLRLNELKKKDKGHLNPCIIRSINSQYVYKNKTSQKGLLWAFFVSWNESKELKTP